MLITSHRCTRQTQKQERSHASQSSCSTMNRMTLGHLNPERLASCDNISKLDPASRTMCLIAWRRHVDKDAEATASDSDSNTQTTGVAVVWCVQMGAWTNTQRGLSAAHIHIPTWCIGLQFSVQLAHLCQLPYNSTCSCFMMPATHGHALSKLGCAAPQGHVRRTTPWPRPTSVNSEVVVCAYESVGATHVRAEIHEM